jgi:RNA polymerase sigma-70 factor (ECF subfamily)
MNQSEIADLILRSRQNDLVAFRQLVDAHQSLVFSVAFRMVCNDDDAKDIVQETFIRVWKHINRFNNDMRFSTWLYKIAVNLCYDSIRAKKCRNNHVMPDADLSVVSAIISDNDQETALINSEMAQIVRFLSHQLTPKQKLVFTLSELEGLEVDEIIEITGLTAAKIKSNLYCARQNIREKLEKM